MSNYSSSTFLNPLSSTDRTIQIYNEDLVVTHTLSTFNIKNVFRINNLIKVNLKSDRTITLDFNSSNEAVLALPRLKSQIDQLSNLYPIHVDKIMEMYVGGTGSNGGATGPQGPIGATGPQGIKGATGSQGSTGSQGLQGIQGIAGVTGSQGIQGISGVTGSQGLQGIQGVVGVTGSQGLQGIQGVVGVTGSQGLQGSQGIAGVTGSQGLQGSQGIAGVTGSQGLQGISGATGPQGVTGGGLGLLNGPTSSVTLNLMDISSITTAVEAEDVDFFTASALVGFPYTFQGDTATWSSPINGPSGSVGTYSQTMRTGLFSLGPIFIGLDQLASYKEYSYDYYTYSNSVIGSEFLSTGLEMKYYFIYAGPTGPSASSQYTHRFYYDDNVSTMYRGDVYISYDGKMSVTYSNTWNPSLEVDNSLQIGSELEYGYGYFTNSSIYLNGTYSNSSTITKGSNNVFIGEGAGVGVDFATGSVVIGNYGSGMTGSLATNNIYLADGVNNLRYHFDGTQSIIKDDLKVEQTLNIGPVVERYGEWIERFGVYEYYCETGNIFYHGTSSFTPGPTNLFNMDILNLPEEAVTTLTFVIEQGATAYEPAGVRIEGVTQSIRWAGGTYSYNSNQVDILGLTILRTGVTSSTILGQTNTFD